MLCLPALPPDPSLEEIDRLSRSNYKTIDVSPKAPLTVPSFSPQEIVMMDASSQEPPTLSSYKDKLINATADNPLNANLQISQFEMEAESDDELDCAMPRITLSKRQKIKMRELWRFALIAKTFGRKVGYNFLLPRVKAQWKAVGNMECIDIGDDFFVFRFSNPEDYHRVISGGPWFVGQYFLTIRPWEPMFSTATAATTSTAVWPQLPQLPLECYEPEILSQIGHILGKPLRVDAHTVGKMSDGKPEQVGKARGGFARICVQVDLNKPLVQKFMISNHIQHVLYENISALCFSCGCIGHRADECKKHTCQSEGPGTPTTTPLAGKEINASTTDSINAVPLIQPTNKDPPMDGYGPWNLVKKKANRHRQQKPEANNRAKSPIPSKSPRKQNGSDTEVGSFNPGQKSSTPPTVKSEQSVGGPPKKSPLAPTDKKLIALPPSAHLPDAHDALMLNLKGKGTLLPPPPVLHEGHSCQAQPSRFQA